MRSKNASHNSRGEPGVAARSRDELLVGRVVPTPSDLTRSSDVSVAGLLVLVMPDPPGSRPQPGVRFLSVLVDDRCAVGAGGAAAAAAGQHRRARRAAGEASTA